MTTYRVVWEVDVEADSPREAAIQAMLMQDEHTTENSFSVLGPIEDFDAIKRSGYYGRAEQVEIDLGDEPRHYIIEELLRSDEIEVAESES